MLSLLKKKSEKAHAQQAPAWHTNFRNFSALPDTKLVRTSFFVNGLLVLLAVAAILAVVYQELSISELSNQLDAVKKQMATDLPASSKAVALYKQFEAAETKVNDLDRFLKGQKYVVSDLLIHLAATKPTSIVFITISDSDSGVSMKGYAQGISEQATAAASAYEKELKTDRRLNTVFKYINMTNVSRDVQAGRLLFDIVMAYTQPKTK